MTDPDAVLLERFAREGSQAAFAEIVRRHVDLVYSVARRTVQSRDLAQDVTQAVFADLARAAAQRQPPAVLGAWLYGVSRRKAVDVVRRETRRRAREQAASELSTMNPPPSPWSQIEAHLDEALESLTERDRGAVVLHYFEKKTFREVGAILGASEDAVQKRVSRALEQLRLHFRRRGITISAAALGSDLLANGVESAPLGLGPAVAASISSGAAVAAAGTISMITIQKTFIAAAVAGAIGLGFYARHVVAERDARIHNLEQVVRDARSRESELRRGRGALPDQAQPNAGDSQPGPRVVRPADPMIAAAGELVAKVRTLKDWLAQHPERAIPELSLLSDADWLEATKEFSIESETDMRKALSAARLLAKRRLMDQLRPALLASAAADGGKGLTSMDQVTPFLTSPVDPAILARYAVREIPLVVPGPGSKGTMEIREPGIAEREEAAVDDDYDTRFLITVGGMIKVEQDGKTVGILDEAISKFAAANGGQPPKTAEELVPFLSAPVDPARVTEYIKGGGHGG